MSKKIPAPPYILRLLLELGGRCRVSRKARGLTQEDLAKLADVGLSTIHAIEGGHDGVSMGNFMKVLYALGLLSQFDEILNPARDPQVVEYATRKLSARTTRDH